MISPELQIAIDNLRIHDVYLRGIVAQCAGDFDPKHFPDFESLIIQSKHHVKKSAVLESDETGDLVLQVFVDLGTRWTDEKEDDGEAVKAFVEAEFVAEYIMSNMLEKSSIDEFCLKNASYHIWPYWRELLSSQCDRMHLPKIVLPTVQLANNQHGNSITDESS